MNNKFIIVNDKAIILDKNGNSRTANYQNNLYEILLKENQIEELEIINNETGNKIVELMKVRKQSKNDYYLPLIGGFIALGILPFIFKKLTYDNCNIIVPILGDMPLYSGLAVYIGISVTPVFGSLSLLNLFRRRKDGNELNALKSAKMYIEDKVLEEQNNLEILRKIDDDNHENLNYVDGDEIFITYNKDFNVDFNNQVNFYYNVGYNKKKYEKYLQKGKLEEKLRRHYSDDEIKEVKEIIKKLAL